MKTNTLHPIANLFASLGIATAIMLGAIATAEAQDNLPAAGSTFTVKAQDIRLDFPDTTINGLFTPTAAQRFYEAGREDFEREADFLADSERYFSGDILEIDEELRQQIQKNPSNDDFRGDNFQNNPNLE